MTHQEKEVGYAVSGCLNDWAQVAEITREMIRDVTAVFCRTAKVDRKIVTKFVETQVSHRI